MTSDDHLYVSTIKIADNRNHLKVSIMGGAFITIYGQGFDEITDNNLVFFGPMQCKTISAS